MRIARHIDQQVAQQAVDKPGRNAAAGRRDLPERDFEFIKGIVPPLIEAWRLTGRSDEKPGEQVGERWMVLPIVQNAGQEVGAAEEWTVGGGHAAKHDVAAPTGGDVAPVECELFR